MTENIYIRILEFGINRPTGFTKQELMQTVCATEWEKQITENFFSLADKIYRHNQSGGTIPNSENTPFILIQWEGGPKYILSHNAFFNYLDYLEVRSAKAASKNANKNAKWALWAVFITTLISLFISIYLTCWQVKQPVSIDEKQFKIIYDFYEKDALLKKSSGGKGARNTAQ